MWFLIFRKIELITSYGPDSDDDDDSDVDSEPLPIKKKKSECLKLTSSKEEIAIGPQLPPGYVVQSTVEEDELLKNSSDDQKSKNCIENVAASIESQTRPAKETLVLGDIPPKPITEKLEKQTDQQEEGPQSNKEIIANLLR